MISKGLIPTSNAKYINNITHIDYICIKHPNEIQHITPAKLKINRGCHLCGIEKNKGKNHYNYQNGISLLNNHLRGLLRPIIDIKLKEYNYKCYLTGIGGTLEIHHLYNFNLIVKDTIKELNLNDKECVKEYTLKDMEDIEKLFILKHPKNWGIPILPEIHNIFHREYGVLNNNKEEFDKFTTRFDNGEFDKELKIKRKKDGVNEWKDK